MIDLLTWSLLVVGITYAVTCSFVFAVPRILISRFGMFTKYFVYCPWCVSFWAGAGAATIYTTDQVWTFEWFGSLVLMGFVAMGIISVLKAAFPTLLVPPFEEEQGREDDPEDRIVLKPVDSWCTSGGPHQMVAQADKIFCGVCGMVESERKKCDHRFKVIGPDERCILCGADRG